MNKWILSTGAMLAVLFSGWCGGVDFTNRNIDIGSLMICAFMAFFFIYGLAGGCEK